MSPMSTLRRCQDFECAKNINLTVLTRCNFNIGIRGFTSGRDVDLYYGRINSGPGPWYIRV